MAPSLTVVVPIHAGGSQLELCLQSLAAQAPAPDQVIVVGDGTDEAALAPAARLGFRVVRGERRLGAAAARNLGAEQARTDLLLFVDSDVVVPPDAVARVLAVYERDPGAAAVFGSYDDRPAAAGLVSQYKNLLHHWTHQHGSPEASTFWTGCGSVRRGALAAVGGFDPSQRWLEDVELGYRLRAAGYRVVLERSLQVTHLKRWSLVGLLVSDIAHRALPWTRLAHRYRSLPVDLNVSRTGRACGLLAALLAVSLAASLWSPRWLVAAALAAGALLALNAPFYRFLWRRRGALFLLGAMPLHWLYYLYSTVAFASATCFWTVAEPVSRVAKERISRQESSSAP